MTQRISENLKRLIYLGASLILFGALAWPAYAQQAKRAAGSAAEEFFIISSVDLKKNHLVLKRPTEVTVLIGVNDKTTCVNEKGKPVRLNDLRAGDTVFVTSRRNSGGELMATRIRMGYMTLQEVHRRYLDTSQD